MIYQILIDRFNGGWTVPPQNANNFLGGNIYGIIDKLDDIKALGATSIWLSPFFKSQAYHGYHITNYELLDFHFAKETDLSYEKNDLKVLIDSAHKTGIKIIADFVPNHCHYNHPFFQDAINNPKTSKYRDWFYFKSPNSSECLHFLGYNELQKFNLDNPETKNYFINIGEKLSNLGVDGFRIDHVLGIPKHFLKSFKEKMHELNPNTFVFGEVWPYGIQRRYFNTLRFSSIWKQLHYWIFGFNQEAIQLEYSDVLDAVLDFEFLNILLSELKAGRRIKNNEVLQCKLERHFSSYSDSFKTIPFLDNHDTNRFLYYCNGDRTLLEEALELLRQLGKEYVIYYGTERDMCNKESVFNGDPYADLRVREPMSWI